MKRLVLYASFFLCLPSLAHSWVLSIFYHSNGAGVVGTKIYCDACGLNNTALVPRVTGGGYCTCHGWSVLRSYNRIFYSPCDPNDDGAPVIAMGDRLADYYGSLPSGVVPAVDLDSLQSGFDPVNPMIAYYPNGEVLTVGGVPYVVTDTSDGDNRYGVPFTDGVASGYVGGKQGTYTLVPLGDNMGYRSSFVPDWSGGVDDSGSSSSLSGGSSSSSVVPYGGSGSGSSVVFGEVSTTPVQTSGGDTYNVINVPSQTVPLSDGNSITLYNYSDVLNAIGANVSSGFSKLHDDNDVINENLRKQLEIDTAVDVAENVDPTVDTDSANLEAQEQLDLINSQGSGWGFDFGLGRNPVGDMITSFFGNPPTSFGSQDQVCQVGFDLPLVGSVQYTFTLSDWFHPAFRSCMLMILTIVFAIASAKAVSGAFK